MGLLLLRTCLLRLWGDALRASCLECRVFCVPSSWQRVVWEVSGGWAMALSGVSPGASTSVSVVGAAVTALLLLSLYLALPTALGHSLCGHSLVASSVIRTNLLVSSAQCYQCLAHTILPAFSHPRPAGRQRVPLGLSVHHGVYHLHGRQGPCRVARLLPG